MFKRAILAIVLLASAPPTGRAQAPITITFANWADAEAATRPGIQAAIAEFERTHPGVKVESQAISVSEIARQLVLRVRSGNPPDVAELQGNDTILLALTGKLEPLDPYLGAGGTTIFTPQALTGLVRGGKLIALPWTVAPVGLWYNKDILRKAGLDHPPATIAELMAELAAIKRAAPDVAGIGIDTTNRVFSMSANWPWMQTFGADPIADGGSGATSAAMTAYLTWMRSLAANGYLQPGQKMGDFRPLAAQNKIAFTYDAVLLKGVIQNITHASDAELDAQWGVTPLPAGPTGKPFAFDSGHNLGLFSDSKHKKEAWEFIDFLATSPWAVENYTLKYETSLPPLRKAPSEAVERRLATPIYRAFVDEIMPTMSVAPFGAGYAAASTAVMAGVQEAVTGTAPIPDIERSIQRNLDKN